MNDESNLWSQCWNLSFITLNPVFVLTWLLTVETDAAEFESLFLLLFWNCHSLTSWKNNVTWHAGLKMSWLVQTWEFEPFCLIPLVRCRTAALFNHLIDTLFQFKTQEVDQFSIILHWTSLIGMNRTTPLMLCPHFSHKISQFPWCNPMLVQKNNSTLFPGQCTVQSVLSVFVVPLWWSGTERKKITRTRTLQVTVS